ncbi:MAG: hypothetical protein KKI06_04190 [Euryarchaeota archaeon]|nr:hypothetical protein [Euryarchaeota archaeon]MCG2738338.1 hypothetical protein [Candidatus Methanoperedenaceae archaeon]
MENPAKKERINKALTNIRDAESCIFFWCLTFSFIIMIEDPVMEIIIKERTTKLSGSLNEIRPKISRSRSTSNPLTETVRKDRTSKISDNDRVAESKDARLDSALPLIIRNNITIVRTNSR